MFPLPLIKGKHRMHHDDEHPIFSSPNLQICLISMDRLHRSTYFPFVTSTSALRNPPQRHHGIKMRHQEERTPCICSLLRFRIFEPPPIPHTNPIIASAHPDRLTSEQSTGNTRDTPICPTSPPIDSQPQHYFTLLCTPLLLHCTSSTPLLPPPSLSILHSYQTDRVFSSCSLPSLAPP